jgi:hypothetical protein
MEPNNMSLRFCRKCNRDLPKTLEYFSPRKTDKDGFRLYCKECTNREKREKRALKRKHWDKGGNVEGEDGRKCTVCKNIYPSTEEYFGVHKHNNVGLDTYCKPCRRAKGRKNYDINKPSWNATHNKTRDLKKQRIIEFKEASGGCLKCGEKKHYLLDFHHVDPATKLFQISQGESKGWEKIKQEMDKCVLLCSNCHREFHYLEKEQNIEISNYINLPPQFNS